MAIMRVALSVCVCLCAFSANVRAFPCGGLSCASQTGMVNGYETISSHLAVPMILGNGAYTAPQRVTAGEVGTSFQRYDPEYILRAGWFDAPTNYQTFDPPPSLGQTGSLELNTAASFQRNPAFGPFNSFLIGVIPVPPAPAGARVASTGALSFLFDVTQYELGFDILGIDEYNPVLNPESILFATFFAEDGSVLDNVTLDVGRGASESCDTSNFFDPPCARHIMYQTTTGRPLIKGVTLSTSDTSGLSYANVAYQLVPEPPVVAILALPLAFLLSRQRQPGRPGPR